VRLERLVVERFRNLEPADLAVGQPFVVLAGPNAQGKTNALEAIHLRATLKPLRSRRVKELVRFGERTAALAGWVAHRGAVRHYRVDLDGEGREARLDPRERQLVHDPRILVLDEPTNGLDPAGRDEMLGLIQRTGREFGISVLVSSHLLGELERVCEHVVLIDAGRLVRAERLGALTGETTTLLVEVDGDVERYGAALAAQGLVVQRDRLRVLVELPSGDDTVSLARVRAAHDVVRDVAVATGMGLLRIERRRGHLEDLFAGALP
jgi:hypothetical protein